MPASSFADLYAVAWDQWQAGRKNEALDAFSKALLFITEVQVYGIPSLKYILELRGVFPNHAIRGDSAAVGSILASKGVLDEKGKEVLAQLVRFAKPYFRA